jgi:putative nucleotidyltransferase with HDIG domain
MNKLPLKVKNYIALVALAGIFFVYLYVPRFHVAQEDLLGFILFFLLGVFSEYMAVTMPFVGMISVTFAIDLAAIMIFGIPGAIIITSLGYIGSLILDIKSRERSLDKFIFNLSLFIVTVTISGWAYQNALSFLGDKDHWHFIATLSAALVFYFVNATLLAILFSLLRGKSLGTIWIMNMRWAVPNFAVLAPIGYMLAYIYPQVGALGILFFFLPLLLARHTFKLYMDMRNMYLNSIKSMAKIIDAKDHYTAGHSERVTKYALMICHELGLDDEYIENLKDIALLHDIGKIGISEGILNKPGRLTEIEYNKMKTHSSLGYDIVKNIPFLKNPEICKYHHERIDGEGYPEGLRGEQIPLGARIIAVADAFDAMTTNRPYRQGVEIAVALQELERCQGTQFDQKVVAALKRAIKNMQS